MELRLMEAKHEANRTKEETERQAELEREVGNAVHKICSRKLFKVVMNYLPISFEISFELQ